MPELIECRVMAETLRTKIVGRTLYKIDFVSDRVFYGNRFTEIRLPATVIGVDSYGKKIFIGIQRRCNLPELMKYLGDMGPNGVPKYGVAGIIEEYLDDPIQYLVSAPLMDGRWLFKEAKHTRAIFEFRGFNIYYDVSRFGGPIELTDDLNMWIKDKKLGPDPFLKDIPSHEWLARFKVNKYQKKEICDVLLNQDIIAGIGNWMKAEILYDAKINPHRLVKDMTDTELERCRVVLYDIIKIAYQHKGLTVHSYWSPDGTAGTYPRKVYELKRDISGNPVVHEPSKGNKRGNHWVPSIQK